MSPLTLHTKGERNESAALTQEWTCFKCQTLCGTNGALRVNRSGQDGRDDEQDAAERTRLKLEEGRKKNTHTHNGLGERLRRSGHVMQTLVIW